MFTARKKGRLATSAVAVGAVIALAGCASGDPLEPAEENASSTDSGTIVVASQAYYSNEIIAEIYAQALENGGLEVERKFQIGQRDAYLPALDNGEVDVIPEYTGNLLQFYSPDTTATLSDEVYDELVEAVPDGLVVLDQSAATDQDSYNVTSEFAEEHGLVSIGDLADVPVELTLGGNAELEERPYGPTGLSEVYGVDVGFSATGDTTVDALVQGTVNVANVYSADPSIASENLVTLEDPEGLFLASNVVPLVSEDVAGEVEDILNEVNAALTAEGLAALNARSVDEQQSADTIATDWLTENGLID
ncbi:ABC transporter substrate-binding protein [Planctomonas psychrotolerans]|uniref:ABC transporter substrate-binding protein n=1 Tax=Planctomonas psychrotolerans TaxID=2528712 RepID=UPI001239B90D|nr:ABC transporter substrate-binding protein [Planctomonas psychrotolerans]